MKKTIELTEAELTILKQFLRLDLEAIGFSQKEQNLLGSILKKLRAVS